MTVGAVGAGSALGTPGVGVIGAPILARGTLERRTATTATTTGQAERPVKIELHKPSDAIVQQVTIAPGGSTGWHSHPGPAIVIVKSGSLTLYDGDDRRCTGTAYSADPERPRWARCSSTRAAVTCTSAGTRARRTPSST